MQACPVVGIVNREQQQSRRRRGGSLWPPRPAILGRCLGTSPPVHDTVGVVCRWRGSPESAGLDPLPRAVFTHCKFDSQLCYPGVAHADPDSRTQARLRFQAKLGGSHRPHFGPREVPCHKQSSDQAFPCDGSTGSPQICCPACAAPQPVPVLAQSAQGSGPAAALEPSHCRPEGGLGNTLPAPLEAGCALLALGRVPK